MHCLNVGLFCIFNIDQDIVQIHYNKNIKLFSKNLVDIVLKTSRCVRKVKEHYLVLKVTIFSTENRFLLITISNSHLIISIGKI